MFLLGISLNIILQNNQRLSKTQYFLNYKLHSAICYSYCYRCHQIQIWGTKSCCIYPLTLSKLQFKLRLFTFIFFAEGTKILKAHHSLIYIVLECIIMTIASYLIFETTTLIWNGTDLLFHICSYTWLKTQGKI